MRVVIETNVVVSGLLVKGSPADDAIVATALAGGAEWLVTGDAGHLLSLGNVGGVAIVSPRAFLEATGV